MPDESLLIGRRGKVLYLTLNRPDRHNALDFGLLEQLTEVLRSVSSDTPDLDDIRNAPDLDNIRRGGLRTPAPPSGSVRPLERPPRADRDGATVPTEISPEFPPRSRTGEGAGGEGNPAVIVLRGAGERAFSAGFDVNLLTGTVADLDADDAVGVAASAIQTCPVPVIACIRGYCFGAGFDLAMACDLRVASDDSQFALPAVRLGVVYRYDLIADLISMCGLGRTRDLLLAMPTLTAAEARSWGLLTDVVPISDLSARVEELAAALAAAPESAVHGTKETIRLLATDSAEGEELEDLRRVAAVAPERQRALQALRERLGIE